MPARNPARRIRNVGIRALLLVFEVAPLDRLGRLVLGAIAKHANRTGRAWPGESTLARATSMTPRSVSATVMVLERLGVLAVERRGWHRPNVYTIRIEALEALPRITRRSAGRVEQNSTLRVENHGRQGGNPPQTGWNGFPPNSVEDSTAKRKATAPPTPPRGGARGGPILRPKGAGGVAAAGNGRSEPTDEPSRWLAAFNRATGTELRPDDPNNLRDLLRQIEKGYTVQQAERVAAWVAATWPGTPRGNFIKPSTVFGKTFSQYIENAKHWSESGGDPLRVNAAWGAGDADGNGGGPA